MLVSIQWEASDRAVVRLHKVQAVADWTKQLSCRWGEAYPLLILGKRTSRKISTTTIDAAKIAMLTVV
jgi:hypothetical protein